MSMGAQIYGMLTNRQRRSAGMLLLLMVVGMALETFGIGLIIPILALLSSNDPVSVYPQVGPFLESLGNPSRENLVIGGMLALACVYATKSLFLAFLAWCQSRFAFDVLASVSQQLYDGYLRQPWAFHLQRNSAQLIRNATGEVNQFIGNVLVPAITLIAEALIVLGIGVLLLVIEPLGALFVASVLGLAAWGFHWFLRGHVLRWGKARQHHDGQRIQHLQQGLGGAKEVKLLGRERDFLERFRSDNLGSAQAGMRQHVIKQLPRLWLELLAVLGLVSLVLVMVWQERPLDLLLPTLGVFAAAAFRLLPSVNRILGAVQSLRYGFPVVQMLSSELAEMGESIAHSVAKPLSFKSQITVRNLGFTYVGASAPALSGIDLRIECGATVGFIGGSGAGKSTLIDLLLGLLGQDEGVIEVDGEDIRKNLRGWQNQIGYVPQTIFLTDDTLRRNIAFGLAESQIDDRAVKRAIAAAQLESFVNSLQDGVDTLVGERGVRLSGGQRQRIGIARALYHDPAVLVLDEATSSLDVATETGVMQAVNELRGQKTVLIVAHRISTVSGCDCIFRLERGRLVEVGDARTVLGALSGSAS